MAISDYLHLFFHSFIRKFMSFYCFNFLFSVLFLALIFQTSIVYFLSSSSFVFFVTVFSLFFSTFFEDYFIIYISTLCRYNPLFRHSSSFSFSVYQLTNSFLSIAIFLRNRNIAKPSWKISWNYSCISFPERFVIEILIDKISLGSGDEITMDIYLQKIG